MVQGAGSSSCVRPIEVFVEDRDPRLSAPEPNVVTSFDHYYDLHGIVTIGSDVALPELSHFLQAKGLGEGTAPDIAIQVGPVGRPRLRTLMVRSPDGKTIRWEEHLGRASANFAVHFGSQILVTSSPALARSPHVLYTNLIEALLRFAFVDRGYVLLHAACLDVDGRGVMLSARTDTGKTGTVLKLLRTHHWRFLSDDMTIVDCAGNAKSYPKPLTISEHTLHAVNAGDLTRREWAWLRLQSHLHSKEGRHSAMVIAEHNVPIMTINGWVQRIIPPPKYPVQRLVPCDLGWKTTIDQLYIIERGAPHHSDVPRSQAIDELLMNTEDAYGFPPYRYLAEALSVGGSNYRELRKRERRILVRAMEHVQIHRLACDDFTWAEHISASGGDPTEQKVPLVNLPTNGWKSHNFLGLDNGSVRAANPVSGSNA